MTIKTDGFCLPETYRGNPVCYFLDDVTETRGIVFQPDVYAMAELLATMSGAQTVWDVGCGWGDKLAAIHDRHPEWGYVGVDYGANIDHCVRTYPWGNWIDHDLEKFLAIPADGGIVVCSDVIEHLADPTNLLEQLRDSGAAAIVISTPERDLMYGRDHNGPPQNLCHVREWNLTELREYLKACGLNVEWIGLTRSSDQGPYCHTTLAVCR